MEENKIILGQTPPNQNQNIPDEFVIKEFKTPTEDVHLPSMGVFYPGGQKTVRVKYLTASEDDILFSPELLKSGKTLDAILNICVIDSNLKPSDMLVGDRNALLIHLRKTGLGEIYNPGDMECPSCQEKHDPDVDLNKLKMKFLETQPDEKGEFDFVLPVMKSKIKFRLLNGNDENRLNALGKSTSSKKPGNYKVSKLVTERYKLQITEVDGNRDLFYIASFIAAMPMRDSAVFREYTKIISPGVDFNYEFTCPHCGHVYEEDVPLTFKLFYPDVNL